MQDHASHAGSAIEAFLPHGFCYLWNPSLLWTHVVSDLLIGSAYVAISFSLGWLVWKGRNEFPFQRMFLAFGLFIIACGATHFVEIWTLWRPDYWFSAGVKVESELGRGSAFTVRLPLRRAPAAAVPVPRLFGEAERPGGSKA